MVVNDQTNTIGIQLNSARDRSSTLETNHQTGDMPDGFIDKPGQVSGDLVRSGRAILARKL